MDLLMEFSMTQFQMQISTSVANDQTLTDPIDLSLLEVAIWIYGFLLGLECLT